MRYLGIDFGMRRVGLAVSEGNLASSWKIVEGRGLKDLSRKIVQIINDEKFENIIVGMPEGKIGQSVKMFINILRKDGIQVSSFDETLSTKKAQKLMIEQGIKQKKRRSNDDKAAAIILQSYLDEAL